jgi:hypothetical protein
MLQTTPKKKSQDLINWIQSFRQAGIDSVFFPSSHAGQIVQTRYLDPRAAAPAAARKNIITK